MMTTLFIIFIIYQYIILHYNWVKAYLIQFLKLNQLTKKISVINNWLQINYNQLR